MPTAAKATTIDTRAPRRSRLRRSRPNWSVPSHAAADGPARRRGLIARGSAGESHWASRPPSNTRPARPSPSIAVLRRQSWRATLHEIRAGGAASPATMAVASGSATEAGIEDGMEEIHDEVDGDERGGEEER